MLVACARLTRIKYRSKVYKQDAFSGEIDGCDGENFRMPGTKILSLFPIVIKFWS